jgi:hypothetical protein
MIGHTSSGTFYATFEVITGAQTDELVLAWPTMPSDSSSPVLKSIWLSAEGPVWGWCLFFAPAVGAAVRDLVIVDSRLELPITTVAPAATQVVNLAINCLEFPVPREAGVPMGLRFTTTGKTTQVGRLRLQWSLEDPG